MEDVRPDRCRILNEADGAACDNIDIKHTWLHPKTKDRNIDTYEITFQSMSQRNKRSKRNKHWTRPVRMVIMKPSTPPPIA